MTADELRTQISTLPPSLQAPWLAYMAEYEALMARLNAHAERYPAGRLTP
jgi:hypothetical protein